MIGLQDYGDARANHRHDPHHPLTVNKGKFHRRHTYNWWMENILFNCFESRHLFYINIDYYSSDETNWYIIECMRWDFLFIWFLNGLEYKSLTKLLLFRLLVTLSI